MARVKGRVPVTFSLSPDVLALVDAHAQLVGLDRYDVMRLALAEGMMGLEFKHQLIKDPQLLTKFLTAQGDAAKLEVVRDAVAEGLEQQIPGGPSKLKRRRKVKVDAL